MTAIDYDPDDAPLFGAFFTCDACDGEGEIIVSGSRQWDGSYEERAIKCLSCQGFGTVYVEEGC